MTITSSLRFLYILGDMAYCSFNDAINGGTKKNRTKIFIGFKSMSSAAHQFGSVEL